MISMIFWDSFRQRDPEEWQIPGVSEKAGVGGGGEGRRLD